MTNIRSSQTQISEILQSSKFLTRHLGSLLKIRLSLMKDVQLATSIFIPSGLTAAASAGDAWIHNRIIDLESPSYLAQQITTMKIPNKEIEDIIKKGKSLRESYLWIKGVSKAIENKVKEQKGLFLSMFLGTLAASLLANLLAAKRYN